MAFPPCSFCGQYECVLMLTSTADGDTVTPCGNCAPGFILTMAAGVVEGMTPGEAESHADALDALAAVRTPPPAPAKRSGKRSGPAEAKSEPEPDASSGQTSAHPLLAICPNCDQVVEAGDLEEAKCPNCLTLFDPRTPIAE